MTINLSLLVPIREQIQQLSLEFHQESMSPKHLRKDRHRCLPPPPPPPPPLPPLHQNHHHPKTHPQNRAIRQSDPSKTHTKQTHWVIYHSYNQTATRTCSNIFTIRKLPSWNLESVPARTWIMVNTFLIVPCHILNFNLIVVGTHIVGLSFITKCVCIEILRMKFNEWSKMLTRCDTESEMWCVTSHFYSRNSVRNFACLVLTMTLEVVSSSTTFPRHTLRPSKAL